MNSNFITSFQQEKKCKIPWVYPTLYPKLHSHNHLTVCSSKMSTSRLHQMYVSAKYELTVQRGGRNYHVGIHAGDLSSCSETGCAVVYCEHCLLCVLTFSSATSCQAVHYASKRPQRLRLVYETRSSEKTTVLQEFSVCGSALPHFTHPLGRFPFPTVMTGAAQRSVT